MTRGNMCLLIFAKRVWDLQKSVWGFYERLYLFEPVVHRFENLRPFKFKALGRPYLTSEHAW